MEDLAILNGVLSLKFDPLNTIYTVTTSENITSLELNYKLSEGASIKIDNNNLINDFTDVVLTVSKDNNQSIYHLYVYKENTSVNTKINNTLEVNIPKKEELPNYIAPLISIICFLIILIVFTILFRKKVKK